ncbi:MAG: PorT family protein [Lunatimonas sp.]|uniref:porin family protein n=1 Tax=Lunatimonas sp. TaxID=2060141 RepID=UPI00263BC31A|nr:porin family protein [Lunatimonas sp.]MCC5938981.1 PorT family protein [Lunatimonas sp.]
MKKLSLLVLVFMGAGIIAAHAQMRSPAEEQKASFGIRGCANFFNWGGSDVSSNDYTNRVGFHAGIFANMFVVDRFAIEPGVYYSVKGTQNDDFADSRAILNYLDVPILFRFYAGEGFNFFAGPQGSILMGSKFEANVLGSTLGWNTDAINDIDAGLVVGLGYNLPVGLNLQASYDLGLTPVFKDSQAEVYNRGFKVSVGISF